MVQSHLHNLSNPISIDFVHRECLDPVLAQDFLFRGVQVWWNNGEHLTSLSAKSSAQAPTPKTDINNTIWCQAWLDPAQRFNISRDPQEETNGTAVKVARKSGFRGVDVLRKKDQPPLTSAIQNFSAKAHGVRIDPNNREILVTCRRSGNGAQSQRVVPTERNGHVSFLALFVNTSMHIFGDPRDVSDLE